MLLAAPPCCDAIYDDWAYQVERKMNRDPWNLDMEATWYAGQELKAARSAKSLCIVDPVRALTREHLPALGQFDVITLRGAGGCDAGALSLLAELPGLSEVILDDRDHGRAVAGVGRDAVRAVASLPTLRSLRAVSLAPSLLAELAPAKELRRLTWWGDVDPASATVLGELASLEELRIRSGAQGPFVPASVFEGPAAGGSLRLVDLSFRSEPALVSLLVNAPGMRDASIHVVNLPAAEAAELRVRHHPTLERLSLGGVWHLQLQDLPRLKELQAAPVTLALEALPSLTTFRAWSATAISLRHLPALRTLSLSIGPTTLEIHDAPRLARVVLLESQVPPAQADGLRAQHPRCDWQFQKPVHKKRKRTAEKRKIDKKAWSHPRFGLDGTTYAALIVGRHATVKAAAVKELAVVAESWSLELGMHITAAPAADLSTAGSYDESAVPTLVGRVIAYLDAHGQPMEVSGVALDDALAKSLPDAFWEESMGVVGNDALDGKDAVHLVASGPLATAMLVAGQLRTLASGERAPDGWFRGQDSDGRPSACGVVGALRAETSDDVVEPIERDDIAASTYLLCRYD